MGLCAQLDVGVFSGLSMVEEGKGGDGYFSRCNVWFISFERSCECSNGITCTVVRVEIYCAYTVGFSSGNVHDCEVNIIVGYRYRTVRDLDCSRDFAR